MKRRDFMAVFGSGVAVWPSASRAQQSKIFQVGVLHLGNADAESFATELREGLRAVGYRDGQNLLFEFRSAEGKLDRLPELAAELVRLKVDVVVVLYTPCALAAKAATRNTPIVIIAGDPVETGLVASLARPGGNVTGVSLMAAPLHGKCVELLHDVLPSSRRIAVLYNPADPAFAKLQIDQTQLAGRTTGLEILPIKAAPDDLEEAFAAMESKRVNGVVVQGSLPAKRIVDLALERHLPAASVSRSFPAAGGLLSYGADGPLSFRQSTGLVHKILQGANPADLPVEQPTKFELVINLRTAKALGLTVPQPIIDRADEVIE